MQQEKCMYSIVHVNDGAIPNTLILKGKRTHSEVVLTLHSRTWPWKCLEHLWKCLLCRWKSSDDLGNGGGHVLNLDNSLGCLIQTRWPA